MKQRLVSWQSVLVILGILIPEGLFFWWAHKAAMDIFIIASLVFLWNSGFLLVRFFTVRFIFDKKEKIWSHILVMFLTSNFIFFGFGTWIFIDKDSFLYRVLPIILFGVYILVWLSQNTALWEIFTFLALALGITFSWLLVIPLAFSGGVLAAITLYSVFVAAYNWAKIHKVEFVPALFFAALVSLVMSEVGWVLLFWPIHLLPLTLLMLGIFYIFGSLSIRAHHKELKKHHVVSHVSFALFVFLILCTTSQWKIPPQ